jgi:proteic killer suppression protein
MPLAAPHDAVMDIEFADPDIKRLVDEPSYNGGYAQPIVRAFRKVVQFIMAAVDERDFRAMRSLNFEKLSGDRSHQFSMRLNDKWRLIIEIQKSNPKNVVRLIEITNHYH